MTESHNKIKGGFHLNCDRCGRLVIKNRMKKETTYIFKNKKGHQRKCKSQKLLCFGCRFV